MYYHTTNIYIVRTPIYGPFDLSEVKIIWLLSQYRITELIMYHSFSLQKCIFSIYCIAHIILSFIALVQENLKKEKSGFFVFFLYTNVSPDIFHIKPRYIQNCIFNLNILNNVQECVILDFYTLVTYTIGNLICHKKIKMVRCIHF